MYRTRLLVALTGAALAAAAILYAQRKPDRSASGCCAHHGAICECTCCDGTPLSELCRNRIPKCGDDAALPRVFDGKVVRVSDGDTLHILRYGRAERIRIAEIDCPEKNQKFGRRAAQLTGELVSGKRVTVRIRDRDRYGRWVADVLLPDGRSVGRELLRAGLAWWYRKYKTDDSLGELEREAARARRGLWADPDPVPPWVFRRNRRR